jgi:hypothetical protein
MGRKRDTYLVTKTDNRPSASPRLATPQPGPYNMRLLFFEVTSNNWSMYGDLELPWRMFVMFARMVVKIKVCGKTGQ